MYPKGTCTPGWVPLHYIKVRLANLVTSKSALSDGDKRLYMKSCSNALLTTLYGHPTH